MFSKSFFTAAILATSAFSSANAQLATVCAYVDVVIPATSVTVAAVTTVVARTDLGSLCLCEDVANGVLTANSLEILRSTISGTGTLGSVGEVVTALVNLVAPTGLTSVNSATAGCTYPAGAISVCSTTSCAYTCTGSNCACPNGGTAVPVSGTTDQFTCQALSGSQRRRRSDLHARSFGACPAFQTACALPGASRGSSLTRQGYECMDTRSNIESCGGCRIPFAGEAIGQDCTEIANADSVRCGKGQCIIDSCVRGFTVSMDGSACVRYLGSEDTLILQ